jgi:DNA gyrase subunit A
MDRAEQRLRAAQRLHVVEAVVTAIDRRAELVTLVAGSDSEDGAMARLQSEWGLTDVQARAALDLQVRRFAGRERTVITEERDHLLQLIADLDD